LRNLNSLKKRDVKVEIERNKNRRVYKKQIHHLQQMTLSKEALDGLWTE